MKQLIFLILFSLATCDKPSPRVETHLGKIEGTVKQSIKRRPIYSFEGVPYAVPPVGKYRFKEPSPIKPWVGTWEAKTVSKCMQYNQYTDPGQDYVIGDEDCLYLNVYTPSLDASAKLDVIIYIHGGAFMFAHGGLLGPEILLDKDVVYVKINYRVGPLGFLSTEDDTIPGNNGLKDQILALTWVKENIRYFGGNPNSVTIIGMSAGGASVHLHYLMPKSKGLFNRGISQSGCALNAWVLMEKPLEKTKKVADIVGCPTSGVKEMVDCLMERPARQIVDSVKHFQPWLYNPFSPFAIVVDAWASNPLLPDHPYRLLKNKQVQNLPWIASFTSSEGLYPASDFYADEQYLEDIDTRWNELMPFILDYNYTVEPTVQNDVSQRIREFYLKDEKVSKATFMDFVEVLSDRLFLVDIEKAARMQASAVSSPVRSYYFTYRGTHSQSEYRSHSSDNLGASHGDDTSYIFKIDLDMLASENDKLISKLLIGMLTSYADTGVPQVPVEWTEVLKKPSSPFTYLKIASPNELHMESNQSIGHREFWETLPIEENGKLLDVKDEL